MALPNGAGVNGGDAASATSPPSPSLRQVCLGLQHKVDAFVVEKVDTKILKAVQAQVKDAVRVINEALDKYRYATATF